MLMTVEKLKGYITTDKPDEVLEDMLQGIELMIRKYTNNNFQKRAYRSIANIEDGVVVCVCNLFKVGDTIQISNSPMNEGLYTVKAVNDGSLELNEDVVDEEGILITKVEYPKDVLMGVVNMVKWDVTNRDKVGISSETISRHSVTYFSMDGDNSTMGYPKSVLGFLKPYIKARF